MFFLITYGMLNLVVFLEQSMKIISFRPTFKIPRLVSFVGGIGCLAIMFLINAAFSIIAIITVSFFIMVPVLAAVVQADPVVPVEAAEQVAAVLVHQALFHPQQQDLHRKDLLLDTYMPALRIMHLLSS